MNVCTRQEACDTTTKRIVLQVSMSTDKRCFLKHIALSREKHDTHKKSVYRQLRDSRLHYSTALK